MKRFLVIRFSSIGDIILTTPVVRCIKKQMPDAEVHFLTKPQFAGLLNGNPYVDKVLTLKPKLLDTVKDVRAGGYACIIDLHHNLRTSVIKMLSGLRAYSFNKLNFRKWILVQFKKDLMPDVHIVDRYLDTVSRFGIKNDGLGLDFFVPSDLGTFASETLPQAHQSGFVCAVIGATHPTKQIPVPKMVQILNSAQMPVCLIGGKDVTDSALAIEKGLEVPCYNAVGKFSINQSAAVIRSSAVVVTPDTGMMHIASALRKRIVSLWGNTVPELGMYPYKPGAGSAIFETKGLSCRPCSKIGFRQCPKGHFNCMNMIDAELVARSIRNPLE